MSTSPPTGRRSPERRSRNADPSSPAVSGPAPSATQPERRSGRDRRQHERVLVDWAVDYHGKDTFLFAYISDISEMGIFVRTQAPEPPGTTLNLSFTPPGGPKLSLEGQVIWINPPRDDGDQARQPGMGIKFVDLTLGQREHLLQLVRTFAYLGDEEEERVGHS